MLELNATGFYVVLVLVILSFLRLFHELNKLKKENRELIDRLELKKICLYEAICTSNTFFKRCRELFKENKELKSKLSNKPL